MVDPKLPGPGLVCLMGPSGAGKSTWAARFSEDAVVVSVDAFRPAVDGFGQAGTRVAFMRAYRVAGAALRRGQSVVFDSTASTERVRRSLRRMAHEIRAPAHLVVFDVADAVCLERNAVRGVPEGVTLSLCASHRGQVSAAVRERWSSIRVVRVGE